MLWSRLVQARTFIGMRISHNPQDLVEGSLSEGKEIKVACLRN